MKTDSTIYTILSLKKMDSVLSKKTMFPHDDVDALLLANNFLEDEDIWELIESTDQQTWDYVHENWQKYPHRVQTILNPTYFMPDRSKLKMRVVELTDESMAHIEAKLRASKMKEFDIYWKTIKDGIERPVDSLDDELDDAWQVLSVAKDRMTQYLAKKKSRYVPPSARKTIDDEQKAIEDEILECKKQFESIEKRIDAADTAYIEKKKNERFEKWLLEVQA
jgi:hypothetical protein